MLSIILISTDVISFHCCQPVINFKANILSFLWSDPNPWAKLTVIIHKWTPFPFPFLLKVYYLCLACCVLRSLYNTITGKVLLFLFYKSVYMISLPRNVLFYFLLVYAGPKVGTWSFTQHRNANNYKEMCECACVREVEHIPPQV